MSDEHLDKLEADALAELARLREENEQLAKFYGDCKAAHDAAVSALSILQADFDALKATDLELDRDRLRLREENELLRAAAQAHLDMLGHETGDDCDFGTGCTLCSLSAALRDEPEKPTAEKWCPVGCGAHEDPGPWHQRGCARWRDEPEEKP